MKKKYNNKSTKFTDWTTKKLKKEAIIYDETIYEIGCFGMSDLKNNSGILIELNKRGIKPHTKLTFD